ncbi:MAG TPA: PIG-L deacetylase family protein [Verrucomicrobiae bacterium]|nr:PIG-L deacetylase family protein [Verrucomicrobiae bacterium]
MKYSLPVHAPHFPRRFADRLARFHFAALCTFLLGFGCTIALHLTTTFAQPAEELPLSSCPTLSPDDRIMVLAPHPDDESIGCGGVIQQAVAMKLPVRIVWLTYGDNNEWSFILYRKHIVMLPEAVRKMGEVRHHEAVAAANILGVESNQLAFLGYPDFGTLTIWYRHWADRPAFESMLTRVSKVPYDDAYRPGAPYKGEDIVRDLEANFREFSPTKVFVSHPADHNVDHQALYLFTRIALWNLESQIHPDIYPYLVHFIHWPVPRGLLTTRSMFPPAYLSHVVDWGIVPLSEPQIHVKAAALRAHRSQMDVSKNYLLSFVRANELFGDFPSVAVATAPAEDPFLAGRREHSPALFDQLTEEEQASFVGIEQVHTWRDSDDLVMQVRLSRPLGNAVSASIFAFGYRDSWPFEQMPKLRINVGALHHDVLDQTRKLPPETIKFHREDRELTVRIPLKAMNNPQRVLTCVHTYLGEDPLDWAEWRILNLTPLP